MDGNAPWYERIPLFGNVGWPIAQKEVRSLIRRNRYFWSQFVYLAFLALAVIVTVTSSQGMVAQQEVVGRRLFTLFFMLQSFLVAVVFPAFAATSFSSEKAERSWELLVTTDLRSYELVWGKFLGIFGNCTYFLLVTLPILGVCILFGGVSFADALENYLLLLIEAALLCIYGIWVSSCTTSNIRAIMSTYAPVLCLGWIPMTMMPSFRSSSGGSQGFFSSLLEEVPGFEWALSVTFAYVVVAAFALFFISAVLRLSSSESNQDTPLRVYALITFGFGVALAAWWTEVSIASAGWSPQDSGELMLLGGVILCCVLPIAVLVFSSGRVEVPLRTARNALRHPKRAAVAWFLLPGGVRGYLFASLLIALCYAALQWIGTDVLALHELPVPKSSEGVGANRLEVASSIFGLLLLGFFAYGGLSFVLAALGIRGFLNWAIVLASAVLISLMAVVYWVQTEPEPGTLSVYFGSSIIVTLMTYLDPATTEPWLVRASMVMHALTGLLLGLLGVITLRMRGLPAFRVMRPGMRAAPNTPESPAVDGAESAQTSAPSV